MRMMKLLPAAARGCKKAFEGSRGGARVGGALQGLRRGDLLGGYVVHSTLTPGVSKPALDLSHEYLGLRVLCHTWDTLKQPSMAFLSVETEAGGCHLDSRKFGKRLGHDVMRNEMGNMMATV